MEAEVRALRAQISPHFIYNSLGAIASFVRTDPDRARELLLEFADFTRYSFRRHGEYTTLAEELRSVERYLLLEQARFGDRLRVTLRIAPEVLPVAVPFLCIQPLVENAVRHGLEAARRAAATISIVARDPDQECVIEVEDDGAGEDPERVRRALAGDAALRLGRARQRRRAAARRRSATTTVWSWRPRPAPAPRSSCGCRSSRPGVARMTDTSATERPPRPGHRRRAARARRAGLPARARRPRVAEVLTSDSATEALRMLQELEVDAVFLDIQMPGLTGLELAQVLSRFRTPPPIVFVTAHEQHAVEPSTCTRSTTCSSRCGPTGSPRPYAAWSTAGAPAGAGRATRRSPSSAAA